MRLTIDLPPALEHWVGQRLADGGYSDLSDYLRDLVRRDRNGADLGDLDEDGEMRALVEEGLSSGVCDEQPEAVVRRIIAENTASSG